MTRKVTLVLVDAAGDLLGALPPFTVDEPWWPEVGDVVERARSGYGVDVAVLRIIGPEGRPGPPGGEVTYIAEVTQGSPLPALALPADGVAGDLAPHPLRAAYARPGGPAATVAWATGVLADQGRPLTGVVQRKTWNLSAIWRLDTTGSPVWIKQVPAFFAHEPAVLRWLGTPAPELVPRILAGEDGRMLLDHVPGEDRFGAPADEIALMLQDLHRIQAYAVDRVDELLALGVPDRRGPAATEAVEKVAVRWRAGLDPRTRTQLDQLVAGLPARFAAVAACGLPDTLVHGDFHPGNVRSDGVHRVIIDWGDSTVGHPAMDVVRACDDLDAADAGRLVAAWADRWQAQLPGCDPHRALALMRPVVDLMYAVVYAGFLDQIEPSERPYHATDVPHHLGAAVVAAAAAADVSSDAARS